MAFVGAGGGKVYTPVATVPHFWLTVWSVEGIIPYCFSLKLSGIGYLLVGLHSRTILLVNLFLSLTDESLESTKLIVCVIHWV
jgi:hypothetical protein